MKKVILSAAARGIRDQTNPDKQSFRFGWSRLWGQIFFAKLEGSPLAPLSTERAAAVLLINDQWGGLVVVASTSRQKCSQSLGSRVVMGGWHPLLG